jgi:hypothetical protein
MEVKLHGFELRFSAEHLLGQLGLKKILVFFHLKVHLHRVAIKVRLCIELVGINLRHSVDLVIIDFILELV